MKGRAIAILASVLVLGAVAWLFWPSPKPMPQATFNLLDGRRLSTEDLRGKPLLVNFWSVSCSVCLRDMPRLTSLHETLGGHGLMVIGVAMPYDPPPAVIDLVGRLAPGYPIALDVHGELSRAFGNVTVTPTTFLIDPAGNIKYSERGPLDEVRIRATVLTFRGATAG